MSKKTERKNKDNKKIRRPLTRKVFIMTMVLMLAIGGTVLTAGFLLYYSGVHHQFFVNTWNLANAEAAVVEQADYRDKCDEIIKIYDSIPESKRNMDSNEYKGKFGSTIDSQFRQLQDSMRDLQDRNGPMNAFIVAIDLKKDRMIYLCDCDPHEKTFCWPGTWEVYPEGDLDVLVEGRPLSEIEKDQGETKKIQAVTTDQPKFGVRCTAGSTLYETDKYTIMVCVDEELEPLYVASKIFFSQYVILLLIVTLLGALAGTLIIRKTLIRHIKRMEKATKAYGERSKGNESTVRYFDNLGINTGDEIEELALTLQGMEEEMTAYMNDLTAVTAEKERINTELSLGNRIQMSMLPQTFPPFPERGEFDVFASMEPAKEVGGDFYDFFMVDDDHVAFVIADVAGKGVPAALFMMASKIVIASRTLERSSPADVLEVVNDRICGNNIAEMFVTVWLGILEISTGKLTTSNAGHEYPVLLHADGQAELIHDPHGFVIGGMEGMKYKDYEIQMKPGDRIFVYTDGVTEATARGEELFGMDRLMESLGQVDGSRANDVLKTVHSAVDEFVGEDEQFDDMTMLCLEYRGPEAGQQ